MLVLFGVGMNKESICSRPHPKVLKTMEGNMRTTFPLSRVNSIYRGRGEEEGGRK
jgi:hypothetical protein